ncbi:preprotein translocase subunit SecD, partial [mine drainage metagenome]
MLEYARWKYILIVVVLLVALLFALPNVFGQAPALQLAHADHTPVTTAEARTVSAYLKQQGVPFTGTYLQNGRLIVRFANESAQFRAQDAIDVKFKKEYLS